MAQQTPLIFFLFCALTQVTGQQFYYPPQQQPQFYYPPQVQFIQPDQFVFQQPPQQQFQFQPQPQVAQAQFQPQPQLQPYQRNLAVQPHPHHENIDNSRRVITREKIPRDEEAEFFDAPLLASGRVVPTGFKATAPANRTRVGNTHRGVSSGAARPRSSVRTPARTAAPAPHAPAAPAHARVAPVAAATTAPIGKRNANTYFLNCCKNKKVAKTCESRCNFDVINKKVLTGMFLGSDPCPQRNGLDLFSCAAQDSDHTPCCRRKNVMKTGAGEKCLAFCKMTPDAHFQADASYLPCWAVLNDIKSCFKEAIATGVEI